MAKLSSDEWKRNISIAMKKVVAEGRCPLSKKGRTPWNKGLRGINLGHPNYNHFRMWTKEEDDYIRANYLTMSALDISKVINRTHQATMCRANKVLKLKRNLHTEEQKKRVSETLLNGYKEGRYKIGYHPKGDKHKWWKGGITPLVAQRMLNIEWMKLRKQIYERDNWTCRICGKHGGRLNCHHITPYIESKDDSPSNLTTLCVPCHARIEQEARKCF